jgi:hypothetical protein
MSYPLLTIGGMCIVCDVKASGTMDSDNGAVAQQVERLRGTQEVARSTRVSSTYFLPDLHEVGYTLAGFVAGEGTFCVTKRTHQGFKKSGLPRLRFLFQVTVAKRDRPLLEALQMFLGFGVIYDIEPKKEGYLPTSSLTIASLRAQRAATIPFAERFLLSSAKRRQFDHWREQMDAYEATPDYQAHLQRRRRSICSQPNCEKHVRGRGLCRSHYYEVTGY